MARVVELADRVAATDLDILLTGEPGVGKQTLARRIHASSRRSEQPFWKAHRSLLRLSELEANLLGIQPTGSAWRDWRKLPGGTVFFTEVGDLDAESQTALYQLTLERDAASMRILAATRRDLWGDAKAGRFRWDLLLNLSEVELRIPPLRERPEDIPPLLDHFLQDTRGARQGRVSLTREHYAALAAYPWPGNVRELRNFVRRMILTGDSPDISIEHLLSTAANPGARIDQSTSLAEAARLVEAAVERQLIRKTLEETGWNRRMASSRLCISYRALLEKIRRLEISPDNITSRTTSA